MMDTRRDWGHQPKKEIGWAESSSVIWVLNWVIDINKSDERLWHHEQMPGSPRLAKKCPPKNEIKWKKCQHEKNVVVTFIPKYQQTENGNQWLDNQCNR